MTEKIESTESRPWGGFHVLTSGHRYKVKRLVVEPGQQTSLQMHHHRSEVWTVVQGTADVLDHRGNIFQLIEGQTHEIEVGEWHRLRNSGKLQLVIIEVQTGSYLEEDDIVRAEDDYGRADPPGDKK